MGVLPGRALILEACVLALVVRIGLRTLALPRLVRLIELLPRAPRRAQDARTCLDAAGLGAARVAHPTCLIVSLVGYAMLRRRGYDTAFHVGVSHRPVFAAHAWLTLDALPVDLADPEFTILWQHRTR